MSLLRIRPTVELAVPGALGELLDLARERGDRLPHTSITALNMAATIHLLKSIDNGGYFEADVSKGNLFREGMTSAPYRLPADGTVMLPHGLGIGVEVDDAFLEAHPFIPGRSFV